MILYTSERWRTIVFEDERLEIAYCLAKGRKQVVEKLKLGCKEDVTDCSVAEYMLKIKDADSLIDCKFGQNVLVRPLIEVYAPTQDKASNEERGLQYLIFSPLRKRKYESIVRENPNFTLYNYFVEPGGTSRLVLSKKMERDIRQ